MSSDVGHSRELDREGSLVRAVVVVVIASLVGACTSAGDPRSGASTSSAAPTTLEVTTTGVVPPTTTLPEPITTTVARRDQYERLCNSRISEGYGPPDAEFPILHVGPIAFLDLDFEWTSEFDDFTFYPEGGYVADKYVTVVDGTAVGPVRLTIAEEDRDSAGLLYDPNRWFPTTLAGSDHTVMFQVCSGRDAQFNGGFVVIEPTCLDLMVIDEGQSVADSSGTSPAVWTATIPYGVAPETCATSP